MAIFNKDFEKLSKSEEIKKTFFVKYYFGMFGKEIKIK